MDRIIGIQIDVSTLSAKLDATFPGKFKGISGKLGAYKASFTPDLTLDEVQTFNLVVSTHAATPMEYQIYKYLIHDPYNHDDPPYGVNYKTELKLRLHRTNTIVKGELIKTEYFADELKTTPVLTVNLVWFRDASGIVTKRENKIFFNFKDGTLDANFKFTEKFYDNFQAIQEIKRRRKNMVDNGQLSALGAMMATIQDKTQEQILAMGQAWLSGYDQEMSKFISAWDLGIIDKLNLDQTGWLDNLLSPTLTIRQFIINELTI